MCLPLTLACSLPAERLLVPKCVMLKSRGSRGHVRFQDAFCGAYFTFAISSEGHVYGFGLSNYHQLGESQAHRPRSPRVTWAPVLPPPLIRCAPLVGSPNPSEPQFSHL